MFSIVVLSRSNIMRIKCILGFCEDSFPFTYFDVPIFIGAPTILILQPITENIKVRFSSWRGKILS